MQTLLTATLFVLVGAGAFALGTYVNRHCANRHLEAQGGPTASSPLGPGVARPERTSQEREVVVPLGGPANRAFAIVTSDPGAQIPPAERSMLLSESSPLVRSLADAGVAVSSLRGLVKVTPVGDGARAMADGSGKFLLKKGGEKTAVIVDKTTGKVRGHALISDPDVLAQISPAIVWTALAYAVGQHFQVEISDRLNGIESKLALLGRAAERQHNAELVAASHEVGRMAGRLLDGEPADRVDAALNSQIHCIETQWHDSLLELDALEKQLGTAREKQELGPDDLSKLLPDVFGNDASIGARLIRFFDVIQARLQLIAVRTAQAGLATSDRRTHFQQSLEHDIAETAAAWQRVQDLAERLSRLQYSARARILGSSSREVERAVETSRVLLDVDDMLKRLEIPMLSEHARLHEVTLSAAADGVRLSLVS